MKKLKLIVTFLVFIFGLPVPVYAKKLTCEITSSTKLTVYKKADSTILSEECLNDNPYISSYLIHNKQKIFINKYSLDAGKWMPKLAAVSIYNKTGKSPLLITIHTQDWDTPTISGVSYNIDLYELIYINGKIKLIDVSPILGENKSGLDGESDQKMIFKLKDIASIKKWLDKNYK